MTVTPFSVVPLPFPGEVRAGDDLTQLLLAALDAAALTLQPRDLLVVAQKIVSKAEGRTLDLNAVTPSPRAHELAALTLKEPRWVEAVLSESSEVVRAAPHVLIVRHRCGFVMANAGIDRSNVEDEAGEERVLLLPLDADASAHKLRETLMVRCGVAPGVIVADSFGRPWRMGVTHVALGAAGVPALIDRRGEQDRHGRSLQVTQVGFGDAVATAAGLTMGEGAEGVPAALLRGLAWDDAPECPAQALVRPLREDLFR